MQSVTEILEFYWYNFISFMVTCRDSEHDCIFDIKKYKDFKYKPILCINKDKMTKQK